MIHILEKFKKLIPPLLADERKQLEESILSEGVRDAIVVWPKVDEDTGEEMRILVDGHNRYEICTANGIQYATTDKHFDSEDEAMKWMILNQFGRRNISIYQRGVLALELEGLFAEEAKRRQIEAGKYGELGAEHGSEGGRGNKKQNPLPANLPEGGFGEDRKPNKETREHLAEIAGIGSRSISKIKTIQEKADDETRAKLQAGQMSVYKAYEIVTKKAHVSHNSGENEWYTPSEYIESAKLVMGSIDLDPASSDIANQRVKASLIYTKDQDGISKTWSGNVWMNPPYSQPDIMNFIQKLADSDVAQAIVLVNNATETAWGNLLLSISSAVCFHKGRIRFLSPTGELGASPLQGQMICYIGADADKFILEFKKYGICMNVAK